MTAKKQKKWPIALVFSLSFAARAFCSSGQVAELEKPEAPQALSYRAYAESLGFGYFAPLSNSEELALLKKMRDQKTGFYFGGAGRFNPYGQSAYPYQPPPLLKISAGLRWKR